MWHTCGWCCDLSWGFYASSGRFNPSPLKGSLSSAAVLFTHTQVEWDVPVQLLRAPLLILSFVPSLLEAIFSHAWVTGKAKLTSLHFDLHCPACIYCQYMSTNTKIYKFKIQVTIKVKLTLLHFDLNCHSIPNTAIIVNTNTHRNTNRGCSHITSAKNRGSYTPPSPSVSNGQHLAYSPLVSLRQHFPARPIVLQFST